MSPKSRLARAALLGLVALLGVTWVSVAGAQLQYQENFDYPNGTALNGTGGWTAHSGAGTNPHTVTTPGLTYTGYAASGIGNAVGLTVNGEDNNHPYTTQTGGSVYAAALVNVSASQTAGDYFLHLNSTPIASAFFARLYAKKDAATTNFAFGLGFTNETTQPFTGFVYTPGTTYLVVLKYTFVAGANNDVVALYIDPVIGASEPAPTLTETNPLATDAASLGAVSMRQGTATNAPTVRVDGIRVSTTWEQALLDPVDHTITATAGANGSISPSGAVTVADGADQSFTITPNTCFQISDVLVDGNSVGAVASYTFLNVTADHTISASFAAVPPAPTTTSVTSDINPSVRDDAVTFTATVTPSTATGTVTFRDSSTVIGIVALSGGQAQLVKSNLSAGGHTIRATYNGSACNLSSVSPGYSQLVYRKPVTIAITSDVNPSNQGENVQFTATVTLGAAGSLRFFDGVNLIGQVSLNAATGITTLNLSNLAPGSHNITASYVGNANYEASTSPIYVQVVNAADHTITATAGPGGSISPSGAVLVANSADQTFTITPNACFVITDVLVNGGSVGAVSSYTFTNVVVDHTISASFTQIPATSSVALTSSLNPSVRDQNVTFTATVTPSTATGTVTFRDSITVLGVSPLVGGVATFEKSNLNAGLHTQIRATYNGSSCTAASASSFLGQRVHRAPMTITIISDENPSPFGNNVMFTAQLTVGAAGLLRFFDAGNFIGQTSIDAVSGRATFNLTNLAPGSHDITASYVGNANYEPGTSAIYVQVINEFNRTITATAGPNGTISPSGPVEVANGASQTFAITPNACFVIADVVVDGSSVGAVSSYMFTNVTLDHTISASFSPIAATSSVALISSLNPSLRDDPVTFTATVTPSQATGTVTFRDSITVIGVVPIVGGQAQLTKSNLNAGLHTLIRATYNGSACTAGSVSSPLAQRVHRRPVTITIISSPNPSFFEDLVEFTAQITVGAAGPLRWFVDGNFAGQTQIDAASGRATLNLSNLTPGSHNITATYVGNSNYEPGASPIFVQQVNTAAAAKPVATNTSDLASGKAAAGPAPRAFALSSAWPNPAKEWSTVEFAVAREAHVKLSVVDVAGRELSVLANDTFAPGRYQARWNARSTQGPVPAGVYFLRYEVPSQKFVQKIVVSR